MSREYDSDSFSDDDNYDVLDDGTVVMAGARTNQQPVATSAKGRASAALVDNFSHHICDTMMGAARSHNQDKSDRATVENVMDPRTRMILFKLVRNGCLEAVHGCVSTGKEANVYYSTSPSGDGLAIKVYRTSILIFKDRERYVEGDFRFQRYCKSNPRKMVQVWAEKESRNLRRLEAAGLDAPRVLQLRNHVLVMSFLGNDGWPYPKLSQATIRNGDALGLYNRAIEILRTMYVECNLVHGDFSEYNLLLQPDAPEGTLPRLYVIDVSQSVEPEHPNAAGFLRRDCANVNRFFSPYVSPDDLATVEDMYMHIIGRGELVRAGKGRHVDDPLRDAVFQQIPIPRSLQGYMKAHVSADVERQYDMLKVGDEEQEEDEEGEEGEEESEQDGEQEERVNREANAGPRLADMSKEERKAHRHSVKEQNREKRKDKVPKHLKKKKTGKKK